MQGDDAARNSSSRDRFLNMVPPTDDRFAGVLNSSSASDAARSVAAREQFLSMATPVDRFAAATVNAAAGSTVGVTATTSKTTVDTCVVDVDETARNELTRKQYATVIPSRFDTAVTQLTSPESQSLLPPPPPSTPSTGNRKNVLLAVTGSVACVKLPMLSMFLLSKKTYNVRVVLTKSACEFFGGRVCEDGGGDVVFGGGGGLAKNYDEELWSRFSERCCRPSAVNNSAVNKSAVSNSAVNNDDPTKIVVYVDSDEWNLKTINLGGRFPPVLHIDLRSWADALVIAPLSANTLSKLATGACDNLLSSVFRAWDFDKSCVLAPSMNTFMWDHPITGEQMETVGNFFSGRKGECRIVEPVVKVLACGDEGKGAMGGVGDIITCVERVLEGGGGDLEVKDSDTNANTNANAVGTNVGLEKIKQTSQKRSSSSSLKDAIVALAKARFEESKGQAKGDLVAPISPTPDKIVSHILQSVCGGKGETRGARKKIIFDLGCGDGRWLIQAAKEFGYRGYGVDIDPLRVELAKKNVKEAMVHESVEIKEGSVWDIVPGGKDSFYGGGLPEADIIVMYLFREAMNRMAKIIDAMEALGGVDRERTVISVGFAIPARACFWEGAFDGIRCYVYKIK